MEDNCIRSQNSQIYNNKLLYKTNTVHESKQWAHSAHLNFSYSMSVHRTVCTIIVLLFTPRVIAIMLHILTESQKTRTSPYWTQKGFTQTITVHLQRNSTIRHWLLPSGFRRWLKRIWVVDCVHFGHTIWIRQCGRVQGLGAGSGAFPELVREVHFQLPRVFQLHWWEGRI